jgi:hypothetical protein
MSPLRSGATITGVPGGINHPAYGARITVK